MRGEPGATSHYLVRTGDVHAIGAEHVERGVALALYPLRRAALAGAPLDLDASSVLVLDLDAGGALYLAHALCAALGELGALDRRYGSELEQRWHERRKELAWR